MFKCIIFREIHMLIGNKASKINKDMKFNTKQNV